MGRPTTARERLRDDSGFTLVEAVVSLFVLGIIFTALAMAAIGSLRASLSSRAEQQAIDFATQALESARQAEYTALGHEKADITADAMVEPCDTGWCFDPGQGSSGPETVVLVPGGSISPHTRIVSSSVNNGVNFTVSTYVTQPATTGADYKRVTVVTRWSIGGRERDRVASSLITATTRGLPIPLFSFETASNSVAVNPGSAAVYRIVLTNQGAPDRWDLSSDQGTWTYWRDNGDNVPCFDTSCGTGVAQDAQMTDSDDPGALVDTGRMDPTTTIVMWAVRKDTDVAPERYWATLTARAVSLDHQGMEGSAGSQSLSLLTLVTLDTVTTPPGPVGPSTSVPSAPRALALTVGDKQLTATWQVPELIGTSPLTGYVVEYRDASDPAWDSVAVSWGDLSRVITGLDNDKVHEVRVAALNSAGRGPFTAPVQATPTEGSSYMMPAICPTPLVVTDAGSSSAVADPSHTLFAYSLHNRSSANGTWPGLGTPPPSRTDTQGLPLNMIKDAPQFGVGTTLPVYSADIAALDRGRVIEHGGLFTSAQTATREIVDWRTDSPAKGYSGTALLTFWVAPATGTTSAGPSLRAQFYRSTTTDSVMDDTNRDGLAGPGSSTKRSEPVDILGTSWCNGTDWQRVVVAMPIQMSKALSADEYLGLRLWNTSGSPLRIAYDVAGDFPATLVLPEK